MLHNVEDEADSLLCEGGNQLIIRSLLPVHAMKTETALGQYEPALWLVNPKSWQTEAVEASRPDLLKIFFFLRVLLYYSTL
jgi:hypothetical protein